MHKSMNKFGLAGIAAALALMPAVTLGQDAMADEPAPKTAAAKEQLTPEQKAAMQSWPADKQAAFKAWPADTQAYFWSLAPARQKLFWSLSDSEKVALSTMPEPQRESQWARIESRAAPSRS